MVLLLKWYDFMSSKPISNIFDAFEKMANSPTTQVSVVDNSEPLLKQLSDIKEFDDRIKFAEEHFKKLGEGSSRTAFQIDDSLILKVAHNEKGIAQNLVEMDPKLQRPCINKAEVADAAGKWIIFPSNDTITEKRFKEIVGFGFKPFMNALFYKFNNESDKWSPPRDYEEIEKNPLFMCLMETVLFCDLQLGDLDKCSSWGEVNGKVVLRDAGLNREVYKDYYQSDSSSTSSSPPKTSE